MFRDDDGELSAGALPVPSSFQCPITQEVMVTPVLTVDGQVYERSAIEQWFRRGHRTSPLTGATLPSLRLTPDLPLKRAIEEYMAQRPEMERRALSELSLEEAARMLESELHEKALLHQSANCEVAIAKRLAAKLREASSSYSEIALRKTVLEVASELEIISSAAGSSASTRNTTASTAQQELAASASSKGFELGTSLAHIALLVDFVGHTRYVRGVVGLDADYAASVSLDSTAKIWSVSSGHCLQTFEGHTDGITSITQIDSMFPTFRFATGSKDSSVKVWEWAEASDAGVCLSTLEGHRDSVTALAALKEHVVLSGSIDNSVKIWNFVNGECQATLQAADSNNSVQSLATFSSNYAAVGSSSKHIGIWDVTTGQALVTLKGHRGSVCGVTALAPGILASCSTDLTVRVWDIGSSKTIAVLEGHEDDVNGVAALGSGAILSCSSDETVKVWDMKRLCVFTTLKGHADSVYGVAALSIDRIVSCSDDKLVKVWGT